ncbi:hypothetical protein SEA_TYPHA_74 [Mycobacterium phage Typha]|uniref:Uncharacterized protein n=1 Tax=Mycobacterium phage Typha TaxID=2517971 RepID=A0A482JBY6_9CAUD|nr:hypothetical protein KCH40_gp095 [Mycobacterium phage Typha]QBP29729.1 hypothetical protein SEA_TYPHA_74 [Mycobacterium phage Typha]
MTMLDDLTAVLDRQDVRAATEFADKHLVDGKLLVTPRQLAEIKRIAGATDDRLHNWWEPNLTSRSSLANIPVVVVKDDGQAHPIGNGRWAVVTHDGIYVFTPPANPFGEQGGNDAQ